MTLSKNEKMEKRIKKKFCKRKGSLMKKANELAELCETDIYVLLARKNKYYVYKSKEKQNWPPAAEIIVKYSISGDISIQKSGTVTSLSSYGVFGTCKFSKRRKWEYENRRRKNRGTVDGTRWHGKLENCSSCKKNRHHISTSNVSFFSPLKPAARCKCNTEFIECYLFVVRF